MIKSKKKWRSLKTLYVRNAKMAEGKSGASTDDTQISWVYFKAMQFLKKDQVAKSGSSNVDDLLNQTIEPEEEVSIDLDSNSLFSIEEMSQISNESFQAPSPVTNVKRPKKRKAEDETERILNLIERQTQSDQNDADYQFCISLVPSLKDLSKKDKLKCRIEILQVIASFEPEERIILLPQ
jgi:hypothetical protein